MEVYEINTRCCLGPTPSQELSRYTDDYAEKFLNKVVDVCEIIGIEDPDHLMACFRLETNNQWSSKVENPKSKAIGLIQFMPQIAWDYLTDQGEINVPMPPKKPTEPERLENEKNLTDKQFHETARWIKYKRQYDKWDKEAGFVSKFMSNKSELEQLDYVERYFKKNIKTFKNIKTPLKKLEDVYFTIFLPGMVQKGLDHVMGVSRDIDPVLLNKLLVDYKLRVSLITSVLLLKVNNF